MAYLLRRLVLIPTGFAAATAVTLFALVTVGKDRISQGLGWAGSTGSTDVSIWAAWQLLALSKTLLRWELLIPPLIVALIGELLRIRSIVYYVLGGGLALAFAPLMFKIMAAKTLNLALIQSVHVPVYQVFAIAGLAGGYVYWYIAQRTA
ncbi:MAG: hypothetical protein RL291_1182 [Pseudomonadota bacterium]|jgi:hypothetical protein